MEDAKKREAALELLTGLLAVPSVNGRDNEGAAAAFVRDYFEAHGIQSHVQEIDSCHANIIAFLPGEDSSRIMIWNGHLDTVAYGDLHAWHTDPARPVVRDGKVFGRGASDMKSGLAAMVFALCSLSDRDVSPACSILFLGTCDEEKGGLGAREALETAEKYIKREDPDNRRRPFLLIGEPTALRPGTVQKGCLWLELRVKGRTSHGAYPEQGINAVYAGFRLAESISAYVSGFTHPLLGRATAQITRINGGVASNMTPDECSIVMDIRMVPGLTSRMVLESARAALEKEQAEIPGLDAGFVSLNDRRAVEIDPGHPKLAELSRLLEERGHTTEPVGINFFTDASVLDFDDRMDVCLFGPGDPELAHQPDEYVEISRYFEAVSIFEKFAAGDACGTNRK